MMMAGRGFMGRAGHMGMGYFGGGWSWIVIVGVVLLAITLIYFAVKKRNNNTQSYGAIDALKMKFAQGEITEKEYQDRKDILERR